jgi:signal transduction histidine kinase
MAGTRDGGRGWRGSAAARFAGWLHDLSLLQRLLIVEGLVFLALLAGVILAANWFAGGLHERIERERLSSTEAFAAEIDQNIALGVGSLRALAGQLADAGEGPARARSLDLLAENSELFTRGVVLTDGDLSVVATDRSHESLLAHDLAREIQAATPGRGYLAWGFRTTPEERPVLALAVARDDGSAAAPGYVVGLVDVVDSSLGAVFLRAQRIAETGHADLVSEAGLALLSTELESLLVSSDHPEFYRRALADHSSPIVSEVSHSLRPGEEDDGNHVMGFATLGELPWGFSLGGSAHETFEPIRQLWWTVFGLAFVFGNFAVTATVVGTARLVRPVRDISHGASQVASGDLDTPIGTSAGGEIGELATSIETMRQSLLAWGSELDARVSERTEELQRRTRELAASAAVAQAVASTLELPVMLETAAAEIARQLGVAGAFIHVTEGGGRPPLARSSPGVAMQIANGAPFPCRECLGAIDGADEVVTLQATDFPTGQRPSCLTRGYSNVTIVPLRSRGREFGALCLLRDDGETQQFEPALLRLLASETCVGVQNALLYAESQRRETHRQALLAKVLNAQEEERRRLARELHDDTGQALTAILMGMDGIAARLPDHPEPALREMDTLRNLTEETLGSLRATILALRPSVLDDVGLVPAIERYADLIVRSGGIAANVLSNFGDERLPPEWEVAVFRIVQESLNNVARHSGARSVDVLLERHAHVLRVTVRDDGQGFSEVASESVLAGVGIEGMTERAELLGGVLTVESSPGRGTAVRLEVENETAVAT